ncbi:peptidase domain-containing ABC transporter [Solitalea koreensis]|uniref:ATP-binding cassette, subfamily B n=1 Tax=Solitalea koreensis TaxID=543615 RepID=A0A521CSC5_9SPHI|nr:peptidase domain-containing ABC transporter [Solitalea koreensis]SMO62332.1 ATP-binding cassette, subfamily B [Solitalea koreensis]
MRKIRIKQHDVTDCGAACLASIAAHYGLHLPIACIRQLASTDKKGTNVLGLIEAATKIGFACKAVKGPVESLNKIPLPAIAHVILNETLAHYLVVYAVSEKHIQVMDPADGKLHRYSHADFKKIWTGVLLLLVPGDEFTAVNEKVSLYSRFWFLIKPHWAVVLQILFGAIIYTILGLSTSIFIQKLVDNVLPEGNKNLLNLMGLIMILLLVLKVFINHAKTILTFKTGQLIDARLILGYYKHLMKLPQQFFDTMRVGEIISRVNDAVKIRVFINDVLVDFAVNIFIVVFSFALMFTYYWKLALIMLLVVPLYSIIYVISDKLNKATQRKLMENSAELESQIVESISGAGTIKRFALEEFSNIKTETKFIKVLHSVYASSVNSVWIGNGVSLISGAFTIGILWIGSFFVLDKIITPGELLSFYAIIGYFTGPVGSLIGMNKTAQDALIAADRLFEIMDLERETSANKMELIPEMLGDIELKNVYFRYGTRGYIFEDISMVFPIGKITAIVGESGSGKSTLMSLIQNIYPLLSGSIVIGKYDIKYLTNESLRSVIAVVPQQIDLFAGSILENIAIGDFNPDIKKVISICTDLGIMDFIEKSPYGFNTPLGENGVNLSGGQRQRLSIARALYKDPDILILDEATASLDSISEQYIQKVILQMREAGKTVLMIAHRLSTVMHVDKIIVLQNGKLVEEGTHQDLMVPGSKYHAMWEQQFPVLKEMS